MINGDLTLREAKLIYLSASVSLDFRMLYKSCINSRFMGTSDFRNWAFVPQHTTVSQICWHSVAYLFLLMVSLVVVSYWLIRSYSVWGWASRVLVQTFSYILLPSVWLTDHDTKSSFVSLYHDKLLASVEWMMIIGFQTEQKWMLMVNEALVLFRHICGSKQSASVQL